MSPDTLRTATAAILLLCAVAGPAQAAPSWTPHAPGIEYARFDEGSTKAYALRIDLCAPGIRMRATGLGEGPRTVSSFGGLVGAAAAINGDWWGRDAIGESIPDTYPRALGIGNGVHFPGTSDAPWYGVVAFGHDRVVHSVQEEDIGGPAPWMQDVVSGQPTLAWDGAARDNTGGHCANYRARTAVGFSADLTTMYMVVVQEVSGSTGMTCNQMGALVQSIGAHSVLNQDGGGSSTMWLSGTGVVNSPSDGSQRSLVNHWGVIAAGAGPPRSCVTREVPVPANGVKRGITSPAVMDAWGFDWNDIIAVDDTYLAEFTTEDPLPEAPELVMGSGPAIYLRDGVFKRHVPNPYAMLAWRFTGRTVATLADSDIDALPDGTVMLATPTLVQGSGPSVYLLDHPAASVPVNEPDAGPGDCDAGFDDVDASGNPGDGDGGADGNTVQSGCAVGHRGGAPGWFALVLAVFVLRRRIGRR